MLDVEVEVEVDVAVCVSVVTVCSVAVLGAAAIPLAVGSSRTNPSAIMGNAGSCCAVNAANISMRLRRSLVVSKCALSKAFR